MNGHRERILAGLEALGEATAKELGPAIGLSQVQICRKWAEMRDEGSVEWVRDRRGRIVMRQDSEVYKLKGKENMSKRSKIDEDVAPEKKEPALHLKYRPAVLKEVIGQDAAVRSLEALLKARSRPQVFLFSGPAGTGKTTLARIVAELLGIEPSAIIEVDAALKTGIDDMRELTAGLRYNGFGNSPNKGIILNECHRLSAQAWDSLLMSVEEPPSHAFFFFTSTNPDKVPKAMLTRCQHFPLRALSYEDILDLLEMVCKEEDYDTPGKVLHAVARACDGSGRAALTMLANVHDCHDEKEAATLLQMPGEDAEIIDLARKLVKGDLRWSDLTAILKDLNEQNVSPESIRLVIVNYLNAVLMNAKGEKEIGKLLDMLGAFMKPATGSEKMAPILLAFGSFLYP